MNSQRRESAVVPKDAPATLRVRLGSLAANYREAVRRAGTAKAAPVVPVAPVPAVTSSAAPEAAPRKSSRAAKAAAMVPPPPAPVVASTAAKASYGPAKAPLPSLVPVIPKKDAKLANNWKTKSIEQLTDADLIAMPDAEYMNDVQMAYFRRKLVQLKQDILANAGETTEHLREDTVIVPDPADRATIDRKSTRLNSSHT